VPLPAVESGRPASSLVTILAELPRLLSYVGPHRLETIERNCSTSRVSNPRPSEVVTSKPRAYEGVVLDCGLKVPATPTRE
jgi:hypothetical protein